AAIPGHVVATDGSPGRAGTGVPPAAVTRSGTQCPAVNGGAAPSITPTLGPGRPGTPAAPAAPPAPRAPTQRSPRPAAPVARPTVMIESSTSSSVRGSSVSTRAWQPR